MKRRVKIQPAAFLLYVRESSTGMGREVLMLRRKNTGHEDGQLGLPSGHLEKGESPAAAAIREGCWEEVHNVKIFNDIKHVHTQFNRSGTKGRDDYLNIYFVVQSWMGDPRIGEPDQCSELCWVRLSMHQQDYPDDVISYVREALIGYVLGQTYSETSYPAKGEHH